MITLNEDKELVRIETWQDIAERPDYIGNIDPKSIKLVAIIGNYMLSDPIPCGLSSCHQPHNKGYLVSTTSNLVTNIGNICGKTHFLVDFQVLRNRFNKDVRIKSQKEQLNAFISRLPGYKEQLVNIRTSKYGADWVFGLIKKLKTPNSGIPTIIQQELQRMARSGNNLIVVKREATVAEFENQQALGGKKIKRPYYIEDPIGSLNGLSALHIENDLKMILVEDIQAGIKRISCVDIESAAEQFLSKESKWANEIEIKFERAENALRYGRQLLEKNNLSKFNKLLNDQDDIKSFKTFLNDLPERNM
ncbi:MAG: hypothetical protein ACYCRF_01915 [Acidithiobacillus sp.]